MDKTQTMRGLAAEWPHEQWRKKDASNLRTGEWECKPDCHRCQLDALADAMEARVRLLNEGNIKTPLDKSEQGFSESRDWIRRELLGEKKL